MYLLVEDKSEISDAHALLQRKIQRALGGTVVRNITFPGDSQDDARVFTDGRYWYWSADLKRRDVHSPRRLNWFGLMRTVGNLRIAVEINIPYEGKNGSVAGCFARNDRNGEICLMHSGRVGGGKKGVGMKAFLAFYNRPLTTVYDRKGKGRDFIKIFPLEHDDGIRPILRYIDTIVSFKEAVGEGSLEI